MKKLIFIIVLISGILVGQNTIAVCQVANKENTIECHEDAKNVCCIIKEVSHSEVCYYSFCYDRNKCEWETLLPPACHGP